MIKNVTLVELNINIVPPFLNTQTLKMKCLCCNKNNQQDFNEKLQERFCNTNFLATTITCFFYCCGKVFTLKNIWMIGKNSVKHHYLKKKIF